MAEARFSIGIDLGTSNSALAYIDSQADEAGSEVMLIGQLAGLDAVREKETLPSCLYALTDSESTRCPADFKQSFVNKGLSGVVGQIALERTADAPSRVIQSAKSWLCHDGVNRHDPLLPWGSESIEAEKRFSPVEASAAYLQHLKNEWNKRFAGTDDSLRFESQHVSITVPASFDEVSQRLTLEAAELAGYPEGVRLLEEPQAAFYFWLENNADSIDWVKEFSSETNLQPTVLVCDIGGGTTDFSFFDLALEAQGGQPRITRTAVSDHLLLGGDNIDLAIAHRLEERLAGSTSKLSAAEWTQLVHQARLVKEQMLTSVGLADAPESFPVSIVGSSSSMFASARSADLSRAELTELLLEGFFPNCDSTTKPEKRQSGLTEWGLPFVADSAVTHHLAEFLNGKQVGAVLFTGGTLSAPFLQQRLLDMISAWQGYAPKQLKNPDLLLAVAHGAAFSGGLHSRPERKIYGGYSHSVYLEVERPEAENEKQLICILPQGTEEGTSLPLERLRFALRVDQMVRFQLFYSNYRHADHLGQLVEFDRELFRKLPPMQTALRYSEKRGKVAGSELEVMLESSLNEIGVLQLHCLSAVEKGAGQRWQLAFNLRDVSDELSNTEQSPDQFDLGVSAERFREAENKIDEVFGKKKSQSGVQAKRLIRDLEQCLDLDRAGWNSSLLRSLWSNLSAGMTARGRSPGHESAWLYLAGFCLRPGYGADLDLWRMTELWRVFHMGMSFPKEKSALVQWWIMWRRLAGGLSSDKQNELYERLEKVLQRKGDVPAELIRLVGSLERIDNQRKAQIAKTWLKRAADPKTKYRDDYFWALGRFGARVPMYAEPNFVLPPEIVGAWIRKFQDDVWRSPINPYFIAFCAQVFRLSGDRSLEVAEDVRSDVVTRLRRAGVGDDQLLPLTEFVPVEDSYRLALFGESIPAGIKLVAQ